MSRSDVDKLPRAALITGGARRVGRAIALALAESGFAVAIHANRSIDEAAELRREIEERGGRAATVRADFADVAAPRALVSAAAGAIGPIMLLVNNACAFERDEFGRLERARWDHQFAVNLAAPLFLAEAFAAQVTESLPQRCDASIINLLDQRVFKLTPQYFSYTLTKSALHAATTTLAQALAPRIRVNAIAPGPIFKSARQTEAEFAQQAAAVPLGHGPSAQEIAAAALYLATAPSVTGQTIAVDGGQHLAWQTPDVCGIIE
jgi:NAD(P)-dependent dehydrogenase (short-subunit alcohol dehydrogenase family)